MNITILRAKVVLMFTNTKGTSPIIIASPFKPPTEPNLIHRGIMATGMPERIARMQCVSTTPTDEFETLIEPGIVCAGDCAAAATTAEAAAARATFAKYMEVRTTHFM